MLSRLRFASAAALLSLAAPAAAQEVLPAAAPRASCEAETLNADMAAFIGPEDADAEPSLVAAAVAGDRGMAVGSLPARPERPAMRFEAHGQGRALPRIAH
jgi:hypothetical protein